MAVFAEPTRISRADTPGVVDVKSASDEVSMRGTAYNEW